jgi:hypothetical protein
MRNGGSRKGARRAGLAATVALAAALAFPAGAAAGSGDGKDMRIPLPKLKLAEPIYMPGSPQAELRIRQGLQEPPAPPFVDSNSPAYWVGSSLALVHSAGVPPAAWLSAAKVR